MTASTPVKLLLDSFASPLLPSSFSPDPFSNKLSAYACIKTSATQFPKPVSLVLTTSLLASNGVKLQQTGLERVCETVDSRLLSKTSISLLDGEEGTM